LISEFEVLWLFLSRDSSKLVIATIEEADFMEMILIISIEA